MTIKHRRGKREFRDFGRSIQNRHFMNRYLLVVNPGLERLLLREICRFVPTISDITNHVSFIKGGVEIDCTHSLYSLSNQLVLPEDATTIAYKSRILGILLF